MTHDSLLEGWGGAGLQRRGRACPLEENKERETQSARPAVSFGAPLTPDLTLPGPCPSLTPRGSRLQQACAFPPAPPYLSPRQSCSLHLGCKPPLVLQIMPISFLGNPEPRAWPFGLSHACRAYHPGIRGCALQWGLGLLLPPSL